MIIRKNYKIKVLLHQEIKNINTIKYENYGFIFRLEFFYMSRIYISLKYRSDKCFVNGVIIVVKKCITKL